MAVASLLNILLSVCVCVCVCVSVSLSVRKKTYKLLISNHHLHHHHYYYYFRLLSANTRNLIYNQTAYTQRKIHKT